MRRLAFLTTLIVAAHAVAQTGDYQQQGSPGPFGGSPAGNNVLIVNWLPATSRIPIKTTPADSLKVVVVRGRRDMHCALTALTDVPTTQSFSVPLGFAPPSQASATAGELNFREALYRRLGALDAKAMTEALRAANGADRAAQYRGLFGVELPALNQAWTFNAVAGVEEPAQMQLNTGQQISVNINYVVCATTEQVDAAIATAKQVYAAVIATMEGKSAGKAATSPASSGLQSR